MMPRTLRSGPLLTAGKGSGWPHCTAHDRSCYPPPMAYYLLINNEIEWFARSSTQCFRASAFKNISFAPHLCFALSMQPAQWAYNRYYRMQHQRLEEFQGIMGMSRMLFLLTFCTVRYPAAASQAIRSLLFWAVAGVHPSSHYKKPRSPHVTLADIPCGGCPTLAILSMFVGMEIGSVGMPGVRYLTGPPPPLQHPTRRGFHRFGSHPSIPCHWCPQYERKNPHEDIDRSHSHRTERSRGSSLP